MGSRHAGPPAEVAALNACLKLQRAADALSARIHVWLPPELTITQFAVLEALHHLGPLCQGELAEKLLKSGGNLTMVVNNLEKAGLVKRERDRSDRRFVQVRLTPSGETLIAELYPRIAQRVIAELSRLTPAEQAELDRLCKKVGLPASSVSNPAA